MDDIEARVKAIIADVLQKDPYSITPETDFREDLRADSLDLFELIMAFEELFDGEISDDKAAEIKTVGDAVAYIRAQME